MNLMETSYSWFKILSGYYENNSEKENFLQTEKSVQFSPKEEKLLNLVRRGKKNIMLTSCFESWLACCSLFRE